MPKKGKPTESKSLYQKIETLPTFWVVTLSVLMALIFGSLGLTLGQKLIAKFRPPAPQPVRELESVSGIIALIEDTEFPRLAIKTSEETFELKGEKAEEIHELQGEKVQIDGFISEAEGKKYRELQVQEYYHLKIDEEPTVETVTLAGIVRPLGISIYMQGTHTLNDDAGEIVALLEASDDKLKLAEGAYVEVTGTLQKSVEGDLPFIKVEKITFR